jgi:hypothetical protein
MIFQYVSQLVNRPCGLIVGRLPHRLAVLQPRPLRGALYTTALDLDHHHAALGVQKKEVKFVRVRPTLLASRHVEVVCNHPPKR